MAGGTVALVNDNPVTAQTGLAVSEQANLAPGGAPATFADLAAQLQPAVVNIATRQKVQVATSLNPLTGERRPVTQEQASGGSGFLISSDGYIVIRLSYFERRLYRHQQPRHRRRPSWWRR